MKYALLALAALPLAAQQPTAADMPQEMVWVDLSGKVLGRVGAVQQSMFFPEISPDGKSIAVSARDGEANDRDIWIHDVATGAKRAVAPAKGNDNFPLWSAGGKSIIFTSSREGQYALYRKSLDPDTPEQRIHRIANAVYPRGWSPDGARLIFTEARSDRRGLFVLPLTGGEPTPFADRPGVWHDGARFSPNGKYVAYASNAAGPWEVYVAEAANPAKVWKVSRELTNGWAGGGGQPRWSADGRQIYYVMGNDTVLSVDVNTEGPFTHAASKRLFAILGMRGNFPEEAPWLAKYDVTADGDKFVFVRTVR